MNIGKRDFCNNKKIQEIRREYGKEIQGGKYKAENTGRENSQSKTLPRLTDHGSTLGEGDIA